MEEQLRRYFRDVADHARRVHEQVTAQRELLTSILEANLALLGVKQNEVVRTISAWAAIIAVPTFLASIWGMNFTHMPELDEPWGYGVALGDDGHRDHGAAPLLQDGSTGCEGARPRPPVAYSCAARGQLFLLASGRAGCLWPRCQSAAR